MAEEQDESQKTEEPTPKKLEESRRKGQVATSREVNHWFIIFGGALLLTMYAPTMLSGIRGTLTKFIAYPHDISVDAGNLQAVLTTLLSDLSVFVLVPMGVLVVFAIAGGLVQNGPILAPDLIKPKLEKISIMKGIKRLFSARSVMEFSKGILKVALVGMVAAMVVVPEFGRITQIPSYHITDLGDFIWTLAVRMIIAVFSVMTVVAGADMFFQKYKHNKEQRMSKQEIKDEHKQSEGDPMIKSRLRQIRMERARQRMMAAVPEATVVITNPTHFAVALKYEHEEMPVPVVVAKGVDAVALRIRGVAEDHDIPIVENPSLAQVLYASAEIDQEVPIEHYKAVAEIIGYVMRLKGKFTN